MSPLRAKVENVVIWGLLALWAYGAYLEAPYWYGFAVRKLTPAYEWLTTQPLVEWLITFESGITATEAALIIIAATVWQIREDIKKKVK